MMNVRRSTLQIMIAIIFAMLASQTQSKATIWQYSVPIGQTAEQRAYLWIPPECHEIRGLIVGLQNMLEKPMLENPIIRRAAADSKLGIVWVAPGSADDQSPLNLKFSDVQQGGDTLQTALKDLAQESGYAEVQYAPILAVGHSAATPFVWGIGFWNADRVFAILPYKGWFPPHAQTGIPTLHISSEYAEFGTAWGEHWRSQIDAIVHLRSESDQCLLGEYVGMGTGHFDWTAAEANIVSMFIRKAALYRLPTQIPHDHAATLKVIDPKSGWLVAPETLGTAACKPMPYNQWKGDPKKAYWFFDAQMAQTINDDMVASLAKKPQIIDFVMDGQPVVLDKNGFADFHPKFLEDGVTFRVEATNLAQSPTQNLYGGQTVGHGTGPIQFKVGSGALKQVGPDTFRVWLDRGGVKRQGAPWEAWIIATQAGDSQYRYTDRPAHIWINTLNTNGQPQTIDFPAIHDQPKKTVSIKLSATSSVGLPIQFYVVSGPAEVIDDKLQFFPIPIGSRFPVRVRVAAYQWGRVNSPKIQSAGPVTQEFFLTQ